MSRRWTPDIAVIGSSLGGVMAAWRASQQGFRVLFVCADAWIGGQMTAQAVPPDEHALIERGGASASYRSFRDGSVACASSPCMPPDGLNSCCVRPSGRGS